MKVKGGRKVKETGGRNRWTEGIKKRKRTDIFNICTHDFKISTSNLQGPPGNRGMRGEIGTFGFKVRKSPKGHYVLINSSQYLIDCLDLSGSAWSSWY